MEKMMQETPVQWQEGEWRKKGIEGKEKKRDGRRKEEEYEEKKKRKRHHHI